MSDSLFSVLLAQDLGAVTFVRDYLQLSFGGDKHLINAYTPVTVSAREQKATFGDDAFANLLIRQINKNVVDVAVRDMESVVIAFEDASTIAISLRPGDLSGPEALNLFSGDGRWLVL